MSSKKWFVVAVFAVLLAVLSLVLLNIIVDPFGVFGDEWYSYNITNNPRVGKIEYLKKNHHKYDSYVIGCSSTSSFPVNVLNEYLNANFYNMIMYGGDMLDVEQTVYYLGENYDVKNLVVNIYISNGKDYDVESDKYTTSMHTDVDGSSKLMFYLKYAFLNPQYAFSKIDAKNNDRYLSEPFDVFDVETGTYDKRKRDAEHVSDLQSFYDDYPVFASYPVTQFNLSKYKECAESVKRIKEYCDKKNINFIPVNGPVYYDYFMGVPKEDVKRYYKALADATDFWDFSISSISLEPRFFYDETHFRNDIGEMIFARIFGDDSKYIATDFGTYITKENVSEYVDSLYGKTFSDVSYTKKLPILLYHHISYTVENDAMVSPARFEEQMKALADSGYTAVTSDDVINYIEKGTELPEKAIMITFDDGYMSNYEYAYPILKKYGLKATIFAVGETYGKDTYPETDVKIYPHLGDKERQEMENSGVVEIQSHTYSMHQNAKLEDGIAYENLLKLESETDLQYVKRIKEDWTTWESAIGKTPKAVAFPHGKSDLLTQAVLNECGVKLTFSTNAKADTLIKGVALSGYSLGRFNITDDISGEELLNIVNVQ